MGEISKYRTKEQVHNRALEIENKPLGNLVNALYMTSSKSSVGDIFEAWFGKRKDSMSQPDLPEAGVELKATPYKRLKNGDVSAKERLVLNIINYDKIVDENFETSHFLYKNKTIELAFYEYLKSVPRQEWTISKVALYELEKNPADLAIIHQDWETIQSYVLDGRAEELSESLTNYLGACTKGANAKSVRVQPFSPVAAKQRAFAFKSSYMTSLLRRFIFGDEKNKAIITDPFELQHHSLREIIMSRFDAYRGKKIAQLFRQFNITSSAKNRYAMLAGAMMGLQNGTDISRFDETDEFKKAGYQLKTVVFDKRGINKESMSFPAFRFKKLVNEEWNNPDGTPSANFHNFLLEHTFILFVVQEDADGQLVFRGIHFMAIPKSVIETDARFVWEDTKRKAKDGIELTVKKWGSGTRVRNNLIAMTDDLTFHVRPHATMSEYVAGSPYSDELPTPAKWSGREGKEEIYQDNWIVSMSFWINSSYIRSQVKHLLVLTV